MDRNRHIASTAYSAGMWDNNVVKRYISISEAEGRLDQLTPGIASTSVATLGKSLACFGSGLLSLSSLIGG